MRKVRIWKLIVHVELYFNFTKQLCWADGGKMTG